MTIFCIYYTAFKGISIEKYLGKLQSPICISQEIELKFKLEIKILILLGAVTQSQNDSMQ